MYIKLTSKIQHLLLIVVMVLNPIIVSADALISDKNDSIVNSAIASTMSLTMSLIQPLTMSSNVEKHVSCHDDNATGSKQNVNNLVDCCGDDPCQCSASGCHTSPATVSSYKSSFVISTYSLRYLRDHYLSFISSPSSPPPIA